MQWRNWLGWLTAGFGLLLILGPHNLFHVCGDEGHMMELANGNLVHMRCWTTASTAQGLGGVVLVLALVMLWSRWRAANRVLGLALAALGGFVALMPTYFTPTCAGPHMVCNLQTRPALIATGIAMMVAGVVGALLARSSDAEGGARPA